MYLDERSEAIFRQIIYNPTVNNRELQEQFSITRNQLNYSIQKINEWCFAKNYPEIRRLKTGHFYLEKELFSLTEQKEPVLTEISYLPSEQERNNLILLMLLAKREQLSLTHFVVDLDVSKNTIMRSFKTIKEQLPPEIELSYSRTDGYQLSGNEWQERKLLFEVLGAVHKMYDGEEFIFRYSDLERAVIERYRQLLEKAESMLQVRFTDDKIELLPFLLAATELRVAENQIIRQSFQIDETLLNDTREYQAAAMVMEDWKNAGQKERLFVTLQLLSTNIFSGEILTERIAAELERVIRQCLDQFEKQAFLSLNKKEELTKRLLYHLKPAYYRIKYQMNLDRPQQKIQLPTEYAALAYVVKDAFRPLETFIGETIPEQEFFYLSLFVFTSVPTVQEPAFDKKYAAVLCKSGVVISQTLKQLLEQLFPELIFHPAMSIREFTCFTEPVDVIFSTVGIPELPQAYVVHPFMNENEKQRLRRKVLNHLLEFDHEFENQQDKIERIMTLIEKNASIHHYDAIKDGLIEIFNMRHPALSEVSRSAVRLVDILAEDSVNICQEAADYQAAIRLASEPLVKKGAVTSAYVEQMIRNHHFDDPYIILGDDVVIPHALPEFGVNQLDMAVLYIQKGVRFSEESLVHFIFILAPVDKEKHIECLYQIIGIAEDKELLERMKECSRSELYRLLRAYTN
ncbi:BglG family transcription antiterminator [Listeria ilorinensis]|uniref:BglG family transcription antiterminator n=1 Tax=Listeria ilorinensis TaxID=2867439 RepID=UPI001EF5A365|nr:BglG family transcription antiterminator [Listeria ilorinensis]